MSQELYDTLCAVAGQMNIRRNEPMKAHTTFRIGGMADLFVVPSEISQVAAVLEAVKQAGSSYFILGNGSNLLVSDEGFRGVVIQIYKNLSEVKWKDNLIQAQAGASLAQISKAALDAGLTGFEFAGGIPGTLGGAVSMNAGAYGGEMKDVLIEAQVINEQGEILTLSKDELKLGYRSSLVSQKGYVVLSAKIGLEAGDTNAIRSRMEELALARRTKQPLEYPSAGSTFKRPEGYFAGKLIQDAGLCGYRVGDAQISEKHCGFVINCGEATAVQIRKLMSEVQAKVKENSGVTLEPEVKMLGRF